MNNGALRSGLKWVSLQQVLVQGFNFVIIIWLNRLLTPHEFGVLGMAMIFFSLLEVIRDFGLGNALVNKENPSQAFISTLFWMNGIISLFLGSIFFLASSIIASFFNTLDLEPILKVFSIILFLNGIITVPQALLVKKMAFKQLFFLRLIVVIISGATAIGWAMYFYDVWSLVIRVGMSSLLSFILIWFWVSWRPQFIMRMVDVKAIWSYSAPLFISNFLNYLVRNIDDLLIGKFFGTNALGLYSRAYSLMLFPVRQISGPFAYILFPFFSKMKEKKKQIKDMYLRVVRGVAFFSFPLMAGLALLAKPCIECLLGEQWLSMLSVLQVFCILGASQSIATLSGSVFMALDETKLQMKYGLMSKPFIILAIVIGVNFGVMGVVIGYTVGSLISTLFILSIIFRLLNIPLRSFVNAIASIIFATIIMILFLWGLIFYMNYLGLPALILLLVGTILGGIVYFSTHFFIRSNALDDVVHQIKLYLTTDNI